MNAPARGLLGGELRRVHHDRIQTFFCDVMHASSPKNGATTIATARLCAVIVYISLVHHKPRKMYLAKYITGAVTFQIVVHLHCNLLQTEEQFLVPF